MSSFDKLWIQCVLSLDRIPRDVVTGSQGICVSLTLTFPNEESRIQSVPAPAGSGCSSPRVRRACVLPATSRPWLSGLPLPQGRLAPRWPPPTAATALGPRFSQHQLLSPGLSLGPRAECWHSKHVSHWGRSGRCAGRLANEPDPGTWRLLAPSPIPGMYLLPIFPTLGTSSRTQP